ncbi:MAG TPA: hypothetical protein VEU09_10725, partial [Candidatus Binatia bacterium]|nr:hypothetical protein [Candidatus Binatia bacterium]
MRRRAAAAIALAGCLVGGGPGTAAARTTLFVKSYVNSNDVQGLVSWNGLLAMATLGGIVTIDPSTGALSKILRSPS